MRTLLATAFAALWVGGLAARAVDLSFPSPESLGTLLNCPSNRFRVEDTLARHREADGSTGGVLAAKTYTLAGSKDFFISIVTSRPGEFLFAAWRDKMIADGPESLREALKRTQETRPDATEQELVAARNQWGKRFRFGEGGAAAAGIIGGGPPGTLYGFALSYPDARLDVTVMFDVTTVSSETLSPEEGAWVSALATNVAAKFLPVATELATQMAGRPVALTEVPWTEDFPASKPVTSTESATNKATVKATKTQAVKTASPIPSAPLAPGPASGNRWLLLSGLAAVAVIAWVLLRRRGG